MERSARLFPPTKDDAEDLLGYVATAEKAMGKLRRDLQVLRDDVAKFPGMPEAEASRRDTIRAMEALLRFQEDQMRSLAGFKRELVSIGSMISDTFSNPRKHQQGLEPMMMSYASAPRQAAGVSRSVHTLLSDFFEWEGSLPPFMIEAHQKALEWLDARSRDATLPLPEYLSKMTKIFESKFRGYYKDALKISARMGMSPMAPIVLTADYVLKNKALLKQCVFHLIVWKMAQELSE